MFLGQLQAASEVFNLSNGLKVETTFSRAEGQDAIQRDPDRLER